MKFISQAIEECVTCNSPKQVNNFDAWRNTTGDKPIVDTNTTYDDGKGIKDTIMIDGPLSQAFTQALLLTLKKEPLTDNEEEPTAPTVVQDGKENKTEANETFQQQEDEDFFSIKDFENSSSEINFLANKFDFVKPEQLPTNVICKTTLITLTDFLKIDNFMEFTQNRSNSSIDHVVVVVSDSLARTSNNVTSTRLIDVGGESKEQIREFNQAVETYVKPAGYKVFTDLKSYFSYLKDLSGS